MNSIIAIIGPISASRTILASPMAYIDPNTGGMLFQVLAVLLAVFSGVVFFFSRQIKAFFAKIRRMIRGNKKSMETESVEQELVLGANENPPEPNKEG